MRVLRRLLGILVLLALLAVLAGWLALRASLPRLDGALPLAGLGAEVPVERDANGVPTVHAENREDLARALGFLHAQDRFFQMDLLRRRAAGELAEVFGAAALPLDREARRHGFRRVAGQVLGRTEAGELRRLDAYAAGVNAGLTALGTRPWEYGPLRARPRAWTREDSVLVVESMTLDLQRFDERDQRTRLAVADTYGEEALTFLWPSVLEATAALDGSSRPAPPVPGPEAMRPRPASVTTPNTTAVPPPDDNLTGALAAWFHQTRGVEDTNVPGSNNFALAGSRAAAGGGALVANDPHLDFSVPNTWYRVSLSRPGRTVTGVTLPGIPDVVIGSNGDVAWAFTNAEIDTGDVVVVETDPADATRYRVPDGEGWEKFQVVRESIPVAGRVPDTVEISRTRWGPLLTEISGGVGGRTLALRWAAHDPEAINFGLSAMADARTVNEALGIAHRAGVPAQNFLVGDRAGHVAWTIIGRVPRRVGFDGVLPQSWADGSRRWDGFLAPEEIPVVRDPPDGQLWTANARVLGGEGFAKLGGGRPDYPARAAQIRDRLSALVGRAATPADGLAVQLDDESRFLFRWRDLLLGVLTDGAVRENPKLDELRGLVRDWHGHAAPGEPGHRLVRAFRREVFDAVLEPIYAPVKARDPGVKFYGFGAEQPLWSILSERPAHLLPSAARSWDALLLAAARTVADLPGRETPAAAMRDWTWGRFNLLKMRHPLSAALPAFIGGWLDMPAQGLPGDSNMPRVQTPIHGASFRMVVSPGREAEGIFHQPGGASGHPLSPFYRAGHEDWVTGRAAPFLPGEPKHRLTLRPAS